MALSSLAFLIRVVGIGFGPYHPDEHLVMNHALAFGTGDLNPRMFYFPSFFLYIVFFVQGVFYMAGHIAGYFHSPEDFLNLYLTSPKIFYILGRLVSAIFGTLSVWAIYALGKEYKNSRTGLLAALFLAVNFLHSRDSHFAVTDIALTFFSILSLYFLFRYWNGSNKRLFWCAAFTAGMACAVKYNALVLSLPMALVYFFKRLESHEYRLGNGMVLSFLWDGLKAAAWMGMAFFIFSPYVLLDFKSALDFIGRLYQINLGFKVEWTHHVQMLFYSLDAPLFVLAAAGLLKSFFPLNKKNFVLLIFFLVYYAMITKAGQPFERYVLVLIPLCILWAASFLDDKAETYRQRLPWLKNPARVFAILITLALLPKTIYSDILFLKMDTRDLAGSWIQRNIPDASGVALDDPGQCPKLYASRRQIADKIQAFAGTDPLSLIKKRRLEKMLSLEPYPTPSYNLFFLKEDTGASFYQMLGPLAPYDTEALREVGVQVLVASDKSMREHVDFYTAFLKNKAELLVSFDPRLDPMRPMNLTDWTYLPIDGFFWNTKRPGPVISIYKIKR